MNQINKISQNKTSFLEFTCLDSSFVLHPLVFHILYDVWDTMHYYINGFSTVNKAEVLLFNISISVTNFQPYLLFSCSDLKVPHNFIMVLKWKLRSSYCSPWYNLPFHEHSMISFFFLFSLFNPSSNLSCFQVFQFIGWCWLFH